MKGIFCAKCFSIHSLPRGDLKSVSCDCGNLQGWWINGDRGIARFTAQDPSAGFMVGWNNQFLQGVAQHLANSSAMARELHGLATDAAGYLFDKSKHGCWCVIVQPGRSNDTAWANAEELAAMRAANEAKGH